jgi:hypothetical protein
LYRLKIGSFKIVDKVITNSINTFIIK